MSKSGRFAPYRDALATVSGKTGVPLPSLIFSFAVLHELTAIVPLVGIFCAARSLGAGERVINAIVSDQDRDDVSYQSAWVNVKFRSWIQEGEQWAGRVGCRYGIFGYEKSQLIDQTEAQTSRSLSTGKLAGDVANAVLAYGMVKALLPVRIGFSLYFSPMFTRAIVEPIRSSGLRLLKRSRRSR